MNKNDLRKLIKEVFDEITSVHTLPWEMTKDDWHDEHLDDVILRRKYPHWSEEKKSQFGIPKDPDVVHREAVEDAVREGKPVPAEVLADYPDLAQPQPAPSKKIIPLNELSLKTMTLNQFLDNGLTEADMIDKAIDKADMLGATTREVPAAEMQDYLKRVKDKKKLTTDKYKMPFVHGGNIEIKDENDRTYDLEKLKLSIKVRPSTLLKQNEKITHSGGDATVYFNLGLPALKGLAVNEKNNEFVIVDTCPGAGACKVYCYAKKGGYVQWKASSMSQTRVLNFLLNDPAGFKNKLSSEIESAQVKFDKKQTKLSSNKNKTKLVIRWHDAGDFFSPEYLNLAYSIAAKFPDVDFYAYTKMASVAVGTKPNNFTTNFSGGSTSDQEKQIDFKTTKHSTVVPKQAFEDLILRGDDGKVKRDVKNRIQFSPENLATLKKKLAMKHSVSADSVITYDEMVAMPVGTEPNWNVIVKPGDGDDSANRADVLGTYLLLH